jgi:hypothetical protein
MDLAGAAEDNIREQLSPVVGDNRRGDDIFGD